MRALCAGPHDGFFDSPSKNRIGLVRFNILTFDTGHHEERVE